MRSPFRLVRLAILALVLSVGLLAQAPQPATGVFVSGTLTTGNCGMAPGNSGVLCGASNTGLTGKGLTVADLTSMSAGNTTSNGQQIIRRNINGTLCIIHDNVVVRESRINGAIQVGRNCSNANDAANGTLVEDNLILGDSSHGINIAGDPPGGGSTNGIYRRNDICCVGNYITEWSGTGDQILSNYGHDEAAAPGEHFDGIEVYGFTTSLVFSNNTFLQTVLDGATAPLNITGLGGNMTGLTAEYNFLKSANSAYVILIDNSQGPDLGTAVFNGNRMWNSQGSGMFSTNQGNAANWSGSGNCQVSSLTTTCGATVNVP